MEIFTSPVSVNLAANFIEKVTSQDERQMLLAMTFGVFFDVYKAECYLAVEWRLLVIFRFIVTDRLQ